MVELLNFSTINNVFITLFHRLLSRLKSHLTRSSRLYIIHSSLMRRLCRLLLENHETSSWFCSVCLMTKCPFCVDAQFMCCKGFKINKRLGSNKHRGFLPFQTISARALIQQYTVYIYINIYIYIYTYVHTYMYLHIAHTHQSCFLSGAE